MVTLRERPHIGSSGMSVEGRWHNLKYYVCLLWKSDFLKEGFCPLRAEFTQIFAAWLMLSHSTIITHQLLAQRSIFHMRCLVWNVWPPFHLVRFYGLWGNCSRSFFMVEEKLVVIYQPLVYEIQIISVHLMIRGFASVWLPWTRG